MTRISAPLLAIAAAGAAFAHPGHGAPAGHADDWLLELLVLAPIILLAAAVALRHMMRARPSR